MIPFSLREWTQSLLTSSRRPIVRRRKVSRVRTLPQQAMTEMLETRVLLAADWGDLPDLTPGTGPGDYQTLAANGGPSHDLVNTNLRLGQFNQPAPDAEADGQPDATATADNSAGANDEQGVSLPSVFTVGNQVSVAINFSNFSTSLAATVKGFIDWNGNGQFTDSGETYALTVPGGVGGVTGLFVTAPGNATLNTPLGARFRISSDPNLTADGPAPDGEVEDYMITVQAVTDYGDAPTGYPVTLAENGARHLASGPTLGANRDVEGDGTHSANADADGADEDGITAAGPLVVGQTTNITINASAPGFVNAWADLNRDNDWDDLGEQFLTNFAVVAGDNVIPFSIPANFTPGTIVNRYRLTSASVASPSPTGLLPDGEVEDYVGTILEASQLVVTTATDVVNNTDGLTSLREAVAFANTNPGDDTITFAPTLTSSGPATVLLSQVGDYSFGPSALNVTSNITIQGSTGDNGITIARDASGAPDRLRLFIVQSSGELTIEGLTLADGLAKGGNGGNSSAYGGGGGAAGLGGAIVNQGILTLLRATLSGNVAQGGIGGNASASGGTGNGGGGGLGGEGGVGAHGGGGGGGVAGPGDANAISGLGGLNTIGTRAALGTAGTFGGGGGGRFAFGGAGGNGGFGGGGGGGHFGLSGAGGFGGGGGGGQANIGGFGGGGGGGISVGASGGFGGGSGSAGVFTATGGGGAGMGGAIFNYGGTVRSVNSTLAGNSAVGGSGGSNGQGLGGAMFSYDGTINVTNTTMAANQANQGGGGIFYYRPSGGTADVFLANSILADSTGPNDFESNVAVGPVGQNNLVETTSATIGLNTITADPALGLLANNGGPTQTMSLLPASPAINAGENSAALDAGGNPLATDQRGAGFQRILFGTVDLGAFESDVEFDFGDAPDSYGTLLASNGARHVAAGPTLGATRDTEEDGQPSAGGTGDGVDEDGITAAGPLVVGQTTNTTINASAPGFVNAWADLNRDNDWDDPGEQFLTNFSVVAGNNVIPFSIPANFTPGTIVNRYRLTSASVASPSPTGLLPDGEVEDYVGTIFSAPVISTNSLTIAEGATIVLSSGHINTTDPDNTPAQLTYTASGVTRGRFELVATPGVAITSFTQAQINSGAVRFVHDGGETGPSYSLTVSDGMFTSAASSGAVTFTNVNDAPTAVMFTSVVSTLQEDTSTTTSIRLADIGVTDVDGGTNVLSLSGPDANSFRIVNNRLFLKAGVRLNFVTKPVYNVTVNVDDATVGGSPDASAGFSLHITSFAPTTVNVTTPTQDMTPTITWSAISTAVSYDVWITNVSTNTVLPLRNVTTNSYTPAADLGIGRFRVWVRSRNAAGVISRWSTAVTFEINTPVTLDPIVRRQGSPRPTILWQPLTGAVRYEIYVSSPTISGFLIRDAAITGTSWSPPNDLAVGRYQAWVRGFSAEGKPAQWSRELNMITDLIVVPAPTLVSPLHATFDRTPTFTWSAVNGAAQYVLRVRNANTGSVVVQQTTTGTSFTLTTALPDNSYNWEVRSVGPLGHQSDFASSNRLYVGGRPVVFSPSGLAGSSTPTFTWSAVEGASRYELRVDRTDVVQNRIIELTNLTSPSHTATTPLPTGTYRFWVRAVSASGEFSPWSIISNFTVASVEENQDLPSDSDLDSSILTVLPTPEPQTVAPNLVSTESQAESDAQSRSVASAEDDLGNTFDPELSENRLPQQRFNGFEMNSGMLPPGSQVALIAPGSKVPLTSDDHTDDLIDLVMSSHELIGLLE